MKIELDDELTKIDFIYRNNYDSAGWVQISGNSFIRVAGSQVKLGMVKAVNIPIAPTKHFFKRKGDYLAYTLYFPALPKGKPAVITTKSFFFINFNVLIISREIDIISFQPLASRLFID